MNNLTITKRHFENVTILDLAGNIRLGEDSIKLRVALRDLIKEGKKQILLNLANVTNIDSSGLGELVASYVSLKKSGCELKLLHLTDRVNELMMITKLLTIFEVYENEKQAVYSFQNDFGDSKAEQPAVITGKLNKALINQ